MPGLVARLRSFWRSLFGEADINAEMNEEFRAHMDMRAADLVRDGLTVEEAGRQARLEFGGEYNYQQQGRDSRGLAGFDAVLHGWIDLRQAARRLVRTPGFALVAVGTLAIGIGVNTAMFGLIDSLLFRSPAHVADPDRVVRVSGGDAAQPPTELWWNGSFPTFETLRSSGVFEDVAAYTDLDVSLGRGVDAVEARAQFVTPNYFRLLGVRPHLGFPAGATMRDSLAANEIVLSHALWQGRFGGDPRVIGTTVQIGQASFVVAGIAPNGFISFQDTPTGVFIPLSDHPSGYIEPGWRENPGRYRYAYVARLKEGTSMEAAATRASSVLKSAAVLDRRQPKDAFLTPIVASRAVGKTREVRVSLWLAGVTALVLLIACANVSNLMLARNMGRGREYAVRLSIGASKWQLRRVLLADIVVLAVPGMLAALLVEYGVRMLIPAFLPMEIPMARGFVDARALLLMAFSGATAIALIGLVSFTQIRPAAMMRALMNQTVDDRRGGSFARGSLIALQSAVCVALLFCAGLFGKSLQRVLALDLGVQMDRTVRVAYNLPRGTRTLAERQALYSSALEQLRKLPGVEMAALADIDPYRSASGIAPFTAQETQEALWKTAPQVAYLGSVGAGYFETVGATFEGRDFTEADRAGAPRVAIINANLARKLWPRGGGLGECAFLYESRECYRIVGIIQGTWRLQVLDRTRMAIYTPLAQEKDEPPGSIYLRTRGDPGRVLASIRSTAQGVEPNLPAVSVRRATDFVSRDFRPWRLGATLFGAFASVALIIAAVGLFGVVSFSTQQRMREIGVRMALGARWPDVIRVVAGAGLGAVVIGLLIGSGASLIASRWMGDVLYQTSPRDPIVLLQTAGVLLAVAALAVIVPVVTALRLAPSSVLRSE